MAPAILAARDREKLVRCLRLLSSDLPGEVQAAGAAAHRIVVAAGLDWADVVGLSPPVVVNPSPDPPKSAPGWRADLARCLRYPAQLTEWERQFLHSVSNVARPSLKQLGVLSGIVAKVSRR
jgi:hypothetical protein